MQKHKDGSVTLTQEELKELNEAYRGLCDVLNDMPTHIGDFFEHKKYVAIVKWYDQLAGKKFVYADWFDEDEDEDEDEEED